MLASGLVPEEGNSGLSRWEKGNCDSMILTQYATLRAHSNLGAPISLSLEDTGYHTVFTFENTIRLVVVHKGPCGPARISHDNAWIFGSQCVCIMTGCTCN